MGSLSLTASKAIQRRGFGPLMPGVYHAPFPDCYRCPLGLKVENCAAECLEFIDHQLFPNIDYYSGLIYKALAIPEDVDLMDEELFEDGPPHELFARMRAEAPVIRCTNPEGGDYWSVTKAADISAVFRARA